MPQSLATSLRLRQVLQGVLLGAALFSTDGSKVQAQHMPPLPLGRGWSAAGMAQVIPVGTAPSPNEPGTALDAGGFYLTQPALMLNLMNRDARVVLRTTLNLEGPVQPEGELSYGAWGEGFVDKRHPHALLHELMLSLNMWDVRGGSLSVSAGRGFAPYGTEDPMSRPVLKYPTNHHLSQILERWTLNGVYLRDDWSVEAGVFAGDEPEGPYDLGRIGGFGRSWSARVTRRFTDAASLLAGSEASISIGRVSEEHDGDAAVTMLYNAAFRHERAYSYGAFYGLLEASRSSPEDDAGYFSVLAEASIQQGRNRAYARSELATRPEYTAKGPPGKPGFFRYDHDAHPIGATRWFINSVGYSYEWFPAPVKVRPFAEIQHHHATASRGQNRIEEMYDWRDFWSLSAGFRIDLGGGPMRMGTYGVLDPMTSMHRGGASAADAHRH